MTSSLPEGQPATATIEPGLRHVTIEPSVLYFGTPVALISTLNPDGTANLAPMSSSWYLGNTVVLGFGDTGQTLPNLQRCPDLVINLPSAAQRAAVERLAPLTGRYPVPDDKRERFRYEPDKFRAASLTEQPSDLVQAPRVAECPVQLEATVTGIHMAAEGGFAIVEARVLQVHVAADLVIPGTNYVDTGRWQPLFYVFRHYFSTGPDLGSNFRAEQ
jgi:flavin reductase (DIM6/NTAB) family NADH-FMN oxidoreductase RutF